MLYMLAESTRLNLVDPVFGGRRLYASEDAAKAAAEDWVVAAYGYYHDWRFTWAAPCKEDADRLGIAAWLVLSRDGYEDTYFAAIVKMEGPA